MTFNPKSYKTSSYYKILQPPTHEAVLSRKINETRHPLVMVNDVPVKHVSFHEHLGFILDSKPNLMNIYTLYCPKLLI